MNPTRAVAAPMIMTPTRMETKVLMCSPPSPRRELNMNITATAMRDRMAAMRPTHLAQARIVLTAPKPGGAAGSGSGRPAPR